MKYIFLYTFLSIGSIVWVNAQEIKGKVLDPDGAPLIGANVVILNTTNGSSTNESGDFAIHSTYSPSTKKPVFILVSFVGMTSDTLKLESTAFVEVQLTEGSNLGEVEVTGQASFIDNMEPIHTEFISGKELTKAACCNLSESFETNASVDVSFSDAITGAKQIQMLGLDGVYTQINRENIPAVRGLTTRFGLSFIPGTWIQSIAVGKGSGSVVNGYESMTGQINVELKKPETSEKLYLNGYVNSFGRLEINANNAIKVNDKVSTGFFIHGNYFNNEVDRNHDTFLDLPRSRQINVLNRWKYSGHDLEAQIGINFMIDKKQGGQVGFGWDGDAVTSSLYGYTNAINKVELFGKIGGLNHDKPYQGWGFVYSLTKQTIDANFGRTNYSGDEETAYGNFIYQSIIGNTFNKVKMGASFLYDNYSELLLDSAYSRQEIVPGAFFEYTYSPNDEFILVAGARYDYHNLYGSVVSPRLHIKINPIGTRLHLRAAAGKGFRVPNAIAENTGLLVSSRQLIVDEVLLPEESWNFGGSASIAMGAESNPVSLTLDGFYTFFENQLVVDLDKSAFQAHFTNLEGPSHALSLQGEIGYSPVKNLMVKGAYKYYNVQNTTNNILQQVPLVAQDRVFLNTSYSSKHDIWKADATLQWFGTKRLPNTTGKPVEYQLPPYSPDFFTLNAQVSKDFRWGEIYLGGENLLDFRQDDPVIAANDPFGDDFDASIVWGPVAGRVIYLGYRFKID